MAPGGGINIFSSIVLIDRSSILNNTARYDGGGVSFARTNPDSQLTVANSQVAGNSVSEGGGGGLRVLDGKALVRNSTISDNTAGDSGGGIELAGASVTVAHSTISGNTAHMAGQHGSGGGISLQYMSTRGFPNELHLDHSIIAGNSDTSGLAPDINATSWRSLAQIFFTAENSIVGDNSESGLGEAPVGAPDDHGNLIGGTVHGVIDPLLAGLADNGGSTLTHALLPGSPAIDAGDPLIANPPEFDQRGVGFPRVAGGRIDIGAFELQAPSLSDQIGNLLRQVQMLLHDGLLIRGQANALLTKLEHVHTKLDGGRLDVALNRLHAFTNQVHAFVNGRILDGAGQPLLNAADDLRMALETMANDVAHDLALSELGLDELFPQSSIASRQRQREVRVAGNLSTRSEAS